MERRTLIRLLVGLGIGIPLLVEGITFLGLLEAQFLGNGGGVTTPVGTPPEGAVAVGGEVLPETAPNDTLSTASLVAEEGKRVFTLTVLIEGVTNGSYEFRVRGVETYRGETIEGIATTGPLDAGESGVVTQRWDLPEGAVPKYVHVTAIVERGGETERIERSVPLARVRADG